MPNIDPRDRLIVALDVPDLASAEAMVSRLGDSVTFYKVGMELAYGGGLSFVRRLANAGKKVFLDLKLHDIPNTVEKATAQVADLGATFLTVHAFPQTMKAAVKGRGTGSLKILAVTVMTSYDDADLVDANGVCLSGAALDQIPDAERITGLDKVGIVVRGHHGDGEDLQ